MWVYKTRLNCFIHLCLFSFAAHKINASCASSIESSLCCCVFHCVFISFLFFHGGCLLLLTLSAWIGLRGFGYDFVVSDVFYRLVCYIFIDYISFVQNDSAAIFPHSALKMVLFFPPSPFTSPWNHDFCFLTFKCVPFFSASLFSTFLRFCSFIMHYRILISLRIRLVILFYRPECIHSTCSLWFLSQSDSVR